jgi:hypothetical protein
MGTKSGNEAILLSAVRQHCTKLLDVMDAVLPLVRAREDTDEDGDRMASYRGYVRNLHGFATRLFERLPDDPEPEA